MNWVFSRVRRRGRYTATWGKYELLVERRRKKRWVAVVVFDHGRDQTVWVKERCKNAEAAMREAEVYCGWISSKVGQLNAA